MRNHKIVNIPSVVVTTAAGNKLKWLNSVNKLNYKKILSDIHASHTSRLKGTKDKME